MSIDVCWLVRKVLIPIVPFYCFYDSLFLLIIGTNRFTCSAKVTHHLPVFEQVLIYWIFKINLETSSITLAAITIPIANKQIALIIDR